MGRLPLLLLAGLFLGGIVHVGAVLLQPALAARDIGGTFAAFGGPGAFRLLPAAAPGKSPLLLADPQMALASCTISLARAPVRVRASLPRGFWSLSVYGLNGRSLFSINDRSAGRGDLDLVIATSAQLTQLRLAPPASLEQAIIGEIEAEAAVVLLRAFVGDASRQAEVEAALKRAACSAGL